MQTHTHTQPQISIGIFIHFVEKCTEILFVMVTARAKWKTFPLFHFFALVQILFATTKSWRDVYINIIC